MNSHIQKNNQQVQKRKTQKKIKSQSHSNHKINSNDSIEKQLSDESHHLRMYIHPLTQQKLLRMRRTLH